jgi:hypothetical protein
MTARAPAAVTARRSSPPRASWRSCSGACSPRRGLRAAAPSLTNKKLRRLAITAGAPKYTKTARGIWSSNTAIRQAERQLAAQAEAS